MVDLIRWLRHHNVPPNDGREVSGFVYVSDAESGPMSSAAAGVRVGNFDDRPPWIVVDHDLATPILAKWPGRLWQVRILQRVPQQPQTYAAYTRATAVEVIQELPLAALFEHDGAAVVDFLCSIRNLSAEARMTLSESRDEDAARVHCEVWDRWISQVDPESPFLGGDHGGIIAVGAKSPRSPVGNATSVLHSEVRRRARAIDGDRAFVVHEEEESLDPHWIRVAGHLHHALFAIGCPDLLLSPSERLTLVRAYGRTCSS